MIEILNICLHQNSISIKFLKILKIHEIFCGKPRIIFGRFYYVHKENMFTINLEDGREAPSKASIIHCNPICLSLHILNIVKHGLWRYKYLFSYLFYKKYKRIILRLF